MPNAFDEDQELVSTRPRSVDVRPNSILGNFESVDKIVVYAFGAFDRYYICWQDKSGVYRQERHGLPKTLDKWLFPDDGTTRDLSSLQVSLGHHDEFFAFDKHERISHKNTEFRVNANRMSHIPHTQTANMMSTLPELRRKSHTFSHSDNSDDPRTMSMNRTISSRRLRPRSIAIAGVFSMRPRHERKQSHENQIPSPELDGGFHSDMSKTGHSPPTRRPAYSDAGVQTDLVEDEEIAVALSLDDLTDGQAMQALRRPFRSHVSSISSLNSLLSDSSVTTNDSASSFSSASSISSRNPVCMGSMQRYFRESQYRLGDALIRAPPPSIGAH